MSQICRCSVYTTVRIVLTTFFTTRMTIAAALASRPEVGSSINIMDGLETIKFHGYG